MTSPTLTFLAHSSKSLLASRLDFVGQPPHIAPVVKLARLEKADRDTASSAVELKLCKVPSLGRAATDMLQD